MGTKIICCFLLCFTSVFGHFHGLEFPQKVSLKPSSCPPSQSFCRSERKDYPVEEVTETIESYAELTNVAEVRDRFFGFRQATGKGFTYFSDQTISPACDFHVEELPIYPRGRNFAGEWKFLLQGENKFKQNVPLIYCNNPGETCKNDHDSPVGQGTTKCRQIFSSYELLVVNSNGTIGIDTFKVPSACVCFFQNQNLVRSIFLDDLEEVSTVPVCTIKNSDSKLLPKISTNNFNGIEPLRVILDEPIQPCRNKNLFCSNGRYPGTAIDNLLMKHPFFKNANVFDTLYGEMCKVEEKDISTRGFFDFDQSNLCTSRESYFYPKRGQAVNGKWYYIINTKIHKQGVLIESCIEQVKNKPCSYGGSEGHIPSNTICKQLYRPHYFFAIAETGEFVHEAFGLPTACVCYVRNSEDDA